MNATYKQRITHRRIKKTHTVEAEVIDNPSTEQYVEVLRILHINEKDFRKEPSKSLANVPDISSEDIHKVLKIILLNYDSFDFSKWKYDAIHQLAVESITFFLRMRLKRYIARKLSLMNITEAQEWLNGTQDKNLKTMIYIQFWENISRQSIEN